MTRASALLACLLAATGVHAATAVHGAAEASPSRDRARTYLMLRVVGALDLSDDKALQMRDMIGTSPGPASRSTMREPVSAAFSRRTSTARRTSPTA